MCSTALGSLKFFVFIFLFFVLGQVFSQSNSTFYDYPEEMEYKNVRISTMSTNLIISPILNLDSKTNSIIYLELSLNKKVSVPLEEVLTIEVATHGSGSTTVIGGLLGLGLGLVAFQGINSAVQAKDPLKTASFGIFAVCAGVGTSLGAFLGYKSKTYKKIFEDGSFI